MTKQRRFTKEYKGEAVRLVATGGRTQREGAEDPGVGLSTLVRWISRRRDRLTEMPDQAAQAIARSIDGFYNPVRRHSALDYISPAQFERTASR